MGYKCPGCKDGHIQFQDTSLTSLAGLDFGLEQTSVRVETMLKHVPTISEEACVTVMLALAREQQEAVQRIADRMANHFSQAEVQGEPSQEKHGL